MSVKRPWIVNDYMTASAVTAVNNGAPIGLKRYRKRFTISTTEYEFDIPGSRDLDLEDFVVQFVCTTETGTSQTVDVDLQGCVDPLSSRTQIDFSAGYSAAATSIAVDAGTGAAIGSGTVAVPLMIARFSSTGSPRVLTAYEWVTATSVSTDAVTIGRGKFGTTAMALLDNDFVFYSQNWFNLVDSGGAAIKLDNFASDGATAAAPKVGIITLDAEGLDAIPTPFMRVQQEAPNAGAITYKVHLSGRMRAA